MSRWLVGVLGPVAPVVVASWFLCRVEVFGEFDAVESVGVAHDFDEVIVSVEVVGAAEGSAVFDLGAAAQCVVFDVVDFAVFWGHGAAGVDASAVEGEDCFAHVVGEEALFSTKV